MKKTVYLICSLFITVASNAQDTFSIVAVDSVTGEVGSAGASCVDLTSFPGLSNGFLGELFPGVGAINTQASYSGDNQYNARVRMNAGDTPDEIITWLVDNDVTGNPEDRQYGIVGLVDGSPQSAAHSGASTIDYSNHITGPNYSIQGNILLGPEILDSMEARFLRAEGDLACKLMYAMQGANVVGADSRCADNGTSSLFAFIKVAQPGDEFGDPSFSLGVRTQDGDGIEPIDSLQALFNVAHEPCPHALNIADDELEMDLQLYPNPVKDNLLIKANTSTSVPFEIVSASGQVVFKGDLDQIKEVDVSTFESGIYIVRVYSNANVFVRRFSKE